MAAGERLAWTNQESASGAEFCDHNFEKNITLGRLGCGLGGGVSVGQATNNASCTVPDRPPAWEGPPSLRIHTQPASFPLYHLAACLCSLSPLILAPHKQEAELIHLTLIPTPSTRPDTLLELRVV